MNLEIMIDLMHEKHNKVFFDYKELAEVINKEFNTNYTEQDIWMYYEPETQDKMIHNNVLKINY